MYPIPHGSFFSGTVLPGESLGPPNVLGLVVLCTLGVLSRPCPTHGRLVVAPQVESAGCLGRVSVYSLRAQ